MEEHRHRRGSGSFLSQLTNSMGNLAPGKRSASTSAERKESDRYIPTLARAKSLSNIRRPPVRKRICLLDLFPLCAPWLTNFQVPSGLTDSTSNTPTESPNKKQKKMSSITKKHRGRAHSTMTTSDNASTSKLKQSRSCDHDLKSRSMVVYNLEFTFADPQSEESPKPVRIIVDYSLETIASSEELTKDFMNFLEKKFASENFRFYLECNLVCTYLLLLFIPLSLLTSSSTKD